MKRKQSKFNRRSASLVALFIVIFGVTGCTQEAREQQAIELSDEQVENIVRRSYPYVALYNVNQKFALDSSSPMWIGGWNETKGADRLLDHTVKAIARPNNDTLYWTAMIDVRREPMILEFPAYDSKYVSLTFSIRSGRPATGAIRCPASIVSWNSPAISCRRCFA